MADMSGTSPVFDPDNGTSWLQSNDAVTVMVPNLEEKPVVRIQSQHLEVLSGDHPIFDHQLAAAVNVEESTWTFSDGFLILELSKKVDMWWPKAIEGGRLGPPNPKKVDDVGASMQKLDAKIGEQVINKTDYGGKSKFQWWEGEIFRICLQELKVLAASRKRSHKEL